MTMKCRSNVDDAFRPCRIGVLLPVMFGIAFGFTGGGAWGQCEVAKLLPSDGAELDQFSSAQLRMRSEERMQNVQGRFDVLSSRLRDTHARMESARVLKSSVSFPIASKISQFAVSMVPVNCAALRRHSPMADSVVAISATAIAPTTSSTSRP